MRVIAGKFRSRSLKSLAGTETRPTYDRLKETLFNVLDSAGVLDDSVFVDLFAGTGSIGIEALSRGASQAYFVEENKRAANVIRGNLRTMGVESEAEVYERDAVIAIPQLAANGVVAGICFLDPPYELHAAYEQTLRALAKSALIGPHSIIVAEHDKRFDPGDGFGKLKRYRVLKQGESALSFYRRVPEVALDDSKKNDSKEQAADQ